ncbi:MAG: hypothetical protein K6T66_07510 [Peptococcaceae bacterium]|nr:hypothetical protein [Peptococcaceae bacterium]
MLNQAGTANLVLLAVVAAATIAAHAKLRQTGRPVWAVIASLAGFGLMLYLIM